MTIPYFAYQSEMLSHTMIYANKKYFNDKKKKVVDETGHVVIMSILIVLEITQVSMKKSSTSLDN